MRTALGIGDQPLGEVVAALGGEHPTPAAGTAVAVTLALAAGLVAKCARKAAGRLDDAEQTLVGAEAWERRALELADEDAERFRDVLDAGGSGDPQMALEGAAEPPLEIAALGVEVAAVAADLTARGKPSLRGDAHAAALLAESAVRSATVLVGLDLAEARADDPRLDRARRLAIAAEESRARAEAVITRGGQ